ncbi:SDR family NAD(P)-dependent oxidoreductase [Deferribacter autotrophicus]|uniref:SDR family NAD(P)-dependent oxidoreductase n=1 Tax=Deferribacter autotrophicus TaxID=500465 RepID=A0A5A8EZY3_9BACT|nr:SDR family NAD(P)-dependent oxidoreductase [Deferribacter autotrophicus]KAA0256934.1 SDR family NAD(P)-dependent oxidoreductase [Deferribacter autotrophicus]
MYILITGATDGIGKTTAIELAKLGYNLIIHGRTSDKLINLQKTIIKDFPNIDIITIKADLSDLAETFEAFNKINNYPINVLINNAATFSKNFKYTIDGFEVTYQVNYLSHFLITHILLDNLLSNQPAKIINVSSMAHSNSINITDIKNKLFPSGYEAYSLSKLCNILFTFKLHDILKNKNISVNCLHPGVINTKLLIDNWGPIGSDTFEGYKMIKFVFDLPIDISGKYFRNFKETKAADVVYDKFIQDELYDITKDFLKDYIK